MFGSDWLANVYMGCFLFGLIFSAVSLFLSVGHMGSGGHAGHDSGGLHLFDMIVDALDGPGHHGVGHGVSHTPATHGHTPSQGHAHAHGLGDEPLGSLSPFNMPTLLAGLTWFGGMGYIFRTTLGLDGLVSAALAVVSGFVGAAILFAFFSRVLWAGQTTPMQRADYYLPGTQARVVSGIGSEGTGEIVFHKGGSRRVEGARSEDGNPILKGCEVVIVRYARGLAYVQPLLTVTDLPPPSTARVAPLTEDKTQPLAGAPALTQDLRGQAFSQDYPQEYK